MKKNLILFFLIVPLLAATQVDIQNITNKVALTNAKVISKAGSEIENATILFEDGIIIAVGQNINLPFDARIIEMDSMIIYPGFISGHSKAGLQKKKKENSGQKKEKYTPGNAPNEAAGIRPELTLSSSYDKNDARLKLLREAGFCVAQVNPNDGMLPGQGSTILTNNQDFDHAVLDENNFQFFQYTPKSGVYPATTIGVIAKFKELYNQSKTAYKYKSQYNSNPVGKKKPTYSAAIKGLYPVVSAAQPLMVACKNDKELYRSVKLSNELGFKLLPIGVLDINPSSEVQSSLSDVFLSLNFPKERKDKKTPGGFTDEEFKSILSKIEESRQNQINLSKRLAERNVKIGYITSDIAPADVIKNVRLAVKQGLSEQKALESLTGNAAQILGIDKLVGSIEKGKLANLVIMDGDLFDEKSKIKHVFINGQQFEIEGKKSKGLESDIAEGTWDFEVDVENTMLSGTMEISKEDKLLDIVVEFNQDTHEFDNIKPDGNSIELSFSTKYQGESFPVTLVAEFDKSTVSGEVKTVNDLNFPLSGTLRNPK